MIFWQLIQLISLFSIAANASECEFDEKSKKMMKSVDTISNINLDNEAFIVKGKEKELVTIIEPKKFDYPTESVDINEDEQVFAFMELMNIINFICEEALKRKDKKTFAVSWISAIYELAKEIYMEQSYAKELERAPDSDDEFDTETLKHDPERFDKTLTHGFKQHDDILFSESDSASSESEFEEEVEVYTEDAEIFDLFKTKMMKEDFKEEKEDLSSGRGSDSDKESQFADCNGELLKRIEDDYKPSENSSDEEDKQVIIREITRVYKERNGKGRAGNLRGVFNSNNLNMAAGMMSNLAIESRTESIGTFEINEENTMNQAGTNSNIMAGVDTAGMMDQMQQQIMAQLMAQLTQNNPQLAQMTSVLQNERGKFEAAMGTDEDGLPQMNQAGMIQFLRTSALPKLLNSAIKGKTGIDVLKSLAMALRVLNEGLGVAEVILKMLIRITKAARYYSLCISDIVADMAREDNMRPMVDLSVPLDSVSMKKKYGGSKMKRLTSMFRKSSKNGNGSGSSLDGNEMSPFTMGMHAALSKSRDYTAEFQKLPSTLLLRLIHTIFAELEKRNGIIRVALARKQHKTLIGLQEEIKFAVERIYEAIRIKDDGAYQHLEHVPPMIITDILITLISPVKMEPAKIESHISKVTTWIKPLMVILDQESQLNILNFLLTDPEAEKAFRKAHGISEAQGVAPKKFLWTYSKQSMNSK